MQFAIDLDVQAVFDVMQRTVAESLLPIANLVWSRYKQTPFHAFDLVYPKTGPSQSSAIRSAPVQARVDVDAVRDGDQR